MNLTLLELAHQKFGLPEGGEEQLLRDLQEKPGSVFWRGNVPAPEDAPEHQANWPHERNVRGEVLEWILTDRAAKEILGYRGIAIMGARIEGELSLFNESIAFPLLFHACYFTHKISLAMVSVPTLMLTGSHIPGLSANGLKVEDDLCLNRSIMTGGRFTSTGPVDLSGARVGGDLNCNGGTFGQPLPEGGSNDRSQNGILRADRLQVEGTVFLGEDFSAYGKVRLVDSRIRGRLVCTGGRFESNEEFSIEADNIWVGGPVQFTDGFQSSGTVRLLEATIEGRLECSGGIFRMGKGAYALNAQGTRVKGDCVVRGSGGKAKADTLIVGMFGFVNADIGGNLVWNSLQHPELAGLDLRGAHCKWLSMGKMDRPKRGRLYLLGFVYDALFVEPFSSSSGTPTESEWWIELLSRLIEDPSAPQDGKVNASSPFPPQPYMQAAKVLREMGHDDAARDVLIAKEERWDAQAVKREGYGLTSFASFVVIALGLLAVQFLHGDRWSPRQFEIAIGIGVAVVILPTLWSSPGIFRRLQRGISRRLFAYGYRTSKAVPYAATWILAAYLLASVGNLAGVMVPTNPDAERWALGVHGEMPGMRSGDAESSTDGSIDDRSDRMIEGSHLVWNEVAPLGHPNFEPFVFAIETFTPLVNLGQKDYWHAEASSPLGWALRWFFWGTTLGGWVITSMFGAAITGLLKQER